MGMASPSMSVALPEKPLAMESLPS